MLLKTPENYKLFKLIESVIQEEEQNKLLNYNIKTILKKMGKSRGFDPEKSLESLGKVPILSKDYIKKFLGAGGFGLVFLMNTGRVLKLFTAGAAGWEGFGEADSAKADIKFYKALQDAQFSGEGSASMPVIYDFGQVDGLYYVEMGQVIPLIDYLRLQSPVAIKELRQIIKLTPLLVKSAMIDLQKEKISEQEKTVSQATPEFFTDTEKDTSKEDSAGDIPLLSFDPKEFFEVYKKVGGHEPIIEKIISYSVASILDDDELRSLVRAWLEAFIASGRRVIDVTHAGNIGVSIQNPKHWMFFDV